MWLGSPLTFSPYIFPWGFPRHQNFDKREEGPSQAQITETEVY